MLVHFLPLQNVNVTIFGSHLIVDYAKMDERIKNIGVLIVIAFVAGGIKVALQAFGIMAQILFGFFPILIPGFAQSLKGYLTSAYFVVGAIITFLSSIGIALNIKEKKILYAIISGIINIISIISLISNLACCN